MGALAHDVFAFAPPAVRTLMFAADTGIIVAPHDETDFYLSHGTPTPSTTNVQRSHTMRAVDLFEFELGIADPQRYAQIPGYGIRNRADPKHAVHAVCAILPTAPVTIAPINAETILDRAYDALQAMEQETTDACPVAAARRHQFACQAQVLIELVEEAHFGTPVPAGRPRTLYDRWADLKARC